MLQSFKDKSSTTFTKAYIIFTSKLKDKKGENYVDSGVRILIAVVIGALLLAGLYALFNDTVMPTLKQRIEDMFNYNA